MKNIAPLFFIGVITLLFFWQFVFKGLLPIPSDTIIGLYHPFRDLYAKEYPNGIPFKNFLITDPVRQQYPWRELAISIEKKFQLPLWNPYNFSGTPLLANFQSAPFYPFNILFFIMPFVTAWSLIIFLGPLLGGIFLFLYLDNIRLNKWASILGAITFSFSGFFVAWMEWGTITHVALWLPLILLSIDKIFFNFNLLENSNTSEVAEWTPPRWKIWSFIFIFSLASALFAGHLQTFFYLFIVSLCYLFARWVQFERSKKIFALFIILYSLFFIITAIQWFPTLQFIQESARNIDQVNNWQKEGWFIPWQNLVQFVAPDFFGNPTTLNYWGVWNYGEFIGYIGIFPLIMAFFALFFRHDKKTLFFGIIFFLSLLFSLPTLIAKLPYLFNIPFLSTSQPTRIIVLIDFSLAVLAALGFDYFLKSRKKKIIYPIMFMGMVIVGLWTFVITDNTIFNGISLTDLLVSKQNLYLPTAIFTASVILILILLRLQSKAGNTLMKSIIKAVIVTLVVFDLFRFGWKFTPFTDKNYLFPDTKAIKFLQEQTGNFRIMTTDSRILPPNFSLIYRLQSIDGYDPLYLMRYGEFIAASERGRPDIKPPFGFNRIITPHNYESKMIDLLGVKYVLSLSDITSSKLRKVFQEGQTIIYINKDVLPRIFFVERLKIAKSKNEAIALMFEKDFNPGKIVIVEGFTKDTQTKWSKGSAIISYYSENKIIVDTNNQGNGFLVFTDSFYPMWQAEIDGEKTIIYRTDYNFRGVSIPRGKHRIEFYNSLF